MIFTQSQKRLLARLVFLLVPYFFLRLGFYFYHLDLYRDATAAELFWSFVHGIRFDVAAICLLNVPVTLLSFLPWINEKYERLCFVLINAAAFLLSIDDFELFSFVGKRANLDFFMITSDIIEQLPQLTIYYWYLPLSAILFSFGHYFFDRRFFVFEVTRPRLPVQIAVNVLIAGLLFLGIRGGLQNKSINVQTAFVQGKNELGHLVLNSPYHFLRSLKNKRIQRVQYFATDEEAKKIILGSRSAGDYKGQDRANVVLIILESFSKEYVEAGYAPFLQDLSRKSLNFEKHLANGRRSIESLPSLLCGLPQLIEEALSKSTFSGNKFVCFPKVLKELGYTNHFFHGGARGTMGFESYTLSNGFDKYFSKEDYPGPNDFDGHWGIYDGPYLQYFANRLDEMKEPFLGGVFTLSSHQPYKIQGSFPKGTLEIHESIGYTDQALRDFFKSIQNKSWFKRTLFIITADHTQKLERPKFLNLVGHFRVPLLLYAPGHKWTVQAEKVTQHSDIPNTVLDYIGADESKLTGMGESVLKIDEGSAVNFADGTTYYMVRGNRLFTLTTESVYNWETGKTTDERPSQNPLLKATLQTYINGLIGNNLSLYR